MMEPLIWELELPEITVEDLFRAQGADYSKRPPRPATVAAYQKALEEAAGLVRPIVIWREVDILGVGKRELWLEDGQKLTSPLLATVAGSASQVILYALTMGAALDERERYYSTNGRIMEVYALDAAGTALVVKSGILATQKITQRYHALGLKTTFPLGPGHSYWPSLHDMRTIFYFLQPERIGLQLTSGNLILPRKSTAMVMGAGLDLPDFRGKTHCDFCSLSQRCQLSHYEQKC